MHPALTRAEVLNSHHVHVARIAGCWDGPGSNLSSPPDPCTLLCIPRALNPARSSANQSQACECRQAPLWSLAELARQLAALAGCCFLLR